MRFPPGYTVPHVFAAPVNLAGAITCLSPLLPEGDRGSNHPHVAFHLVRRLQNHRGNPGGSMRRLLSRYIAVTAALVTSASVAAAQGGTTISGRVTNDAGAPLPGA